MFQAENQTNFEGDAGLSPGKLLQAARQSQQLTHMDVANKLRLSEQYVKDLESDEYSHIGARIYVRGYLLNYAKLLGVPTEDMIRAIQASLLPDENLAMQRMLERNSAPINIRLNPYGHEKRHLTKWFVGFFLLLVVLLVVVWWQNQKTHLYSSVQAENPLSPNADNAKQKNEQSISIAPSGNSTGDKNQAADSSQGNGNNLSPVGSSNLQNQAGALATQLPASTTESTNDTGSNVIVTQQPMTPQGNNASLAPNPNSSAPVPSVSSENLQKPSQNFGTAIKPTSAASNQNPSEVNSVQKLSSTNSTTSPNMSSEVKSTAGSNTSSNKYTRRKHYHPYRSSRYSSRNQLPAPGGN